MTLKLSAVRAAVAYRGVAFASAIFDVATVTGDTLEIDSDKFLRLLRQFPRQGEERFRRRTLRESVDSAVAVKANCFGPDGILLPGSPCNKKRSV